jgi:hypothetical protein
MILIFSQDVFLILCIYIETSSGKIQQILQLILEFSVHCTVSEWYELPIFWTDSLLLYLASALKQGGGISSESLVINCSHWSMVQLHDDYSYHCAWCCLPRGAY